VVKAYDTAEAFAARKDLFSHGCLPPDLRAGIVGAPLT
jgi:hypothetical protein